MTRKDAAAPAAGAPERGRVDEALYATLRAIYHFERDLYARFGLGYQEICLLQLLRRRPGLRVGEAAKALELPLFAATRTVKRLEGRSFLRKARDPEDGRALRLALRPEGEALIAEIEAENYGRIAANLRGLSRREVEGLVLAAERIGALLGVEERSGEGA
ncbi:MAG TPA: MarR family transcriptional regulator [Spirochaetales bacterium]|nr:MarR family transcriptional regulator [Spirochaetales bacterium]HRY54574.1 MarR family transcriptional regulator [Spirochaetia bacterium]HRZ64582.1 MarR family transcriptional regulator [Spirochaetia bacterium]